jgi:hypothetical protein
MAVFTNGLKRWQATLFLRWRRGEKEEEKRRTLMKEAFYNRAMPIG